MSSFLEEVAQQDRGASVKCGVPRTLAGISDERLRAEVAAAIADPSLPAAAIGRALAARGHRMAEQSITRHRRGACRCSDG